MYVSTVSEQTLFIVTGYSCRISAEAEGKSNQSGLYFFGLSQKTTNSAQLVITFLYGVWKETQASCEYHEEQ